MPSSSLGFRPWKADGSGQSMPAALIEAWRFEVEWRCALTGLLVGPAFLGVLVTSRGSIGSCKRTLGESDRRSALRYGGGPAMEVPEGEVGDRPGSIPGANVDSAGQVFASGFRGILDGVSGTGGALMSH